MKNTKVASDYSNIEANDSRMSTSTNCNRNANLI